MSTVNGSKEASLIDPPASAGNRTPIDCLEGNHANHYTTDAYNSAANRRFPKERE